MLQAFLKKVVRRKSFDLKAGKTIGFRAEGAEFLAKEKPSHVAFAIDVAALLPTSEKHGRFAMATQTVITVGIFLRSPDYPNDP